MPLPPSLSPEQRAAALEKAAEARKARADLKNELKLGHITLESLLERASKEELVGKMKVISVLESLPGIGKVKARKLMAEIGVSETRRLQGLGANQKIRLIEETTKS
ncbi:MAG: integration host factor, actinobacterial type [Acidimicrobiales bacterium]